VLQEFGTLPSFKLSERQKLPECSAIYFAIARDQVLYVGLATNLRNRWQNHHRIPQLATLNKRCEIRLFWLSCPQNQLNNLEHQYIEYYCPNLNRTKVPNRQIIPSFQMLTLSLKKLSDRLIGVGVQDADNQRLKTLVLFYLSHHKETRLITTNLRKTLQAITKKPDSMFRWTEVVRSKDAAHWRTRCNGIEVQLLPWVGERLMHNPSMYTVMYEKLYGLGTAIPMDKYNDLRQKVKAMSFLERLELIRASKISQDLLFPLAYGAEFHNISGVEILCLTNTQIQCMFAKYPFLQEDYPRISAIDSDPVPRLEF